MCCTIQAVQEHITVDDVNEIMGVGTTRWCQTHGSEERTTHDVLDQQEIDLAALVKHQAADKTLQSLFKQFASQCKTLFKQ
jgi:hypothetical protein